MNYKAEEEEQEASQGVMVIFRQEMLVTWDNCSRKGENGYIVLDHLISQI